MAVLPTRKIDLLPKLYLPLLLLLGASCAWRPLSGGDDFWAHAAVGRWIWQHQQVPHQTLFLWGAAPIPWIAHSWLTQLTFYGLMASGGDRYGPYVAVGFSVLMALLPVALLWRLWTRRASVAVLAPCVFALAIWCAAPRFHPRPEVFSAFFLTCLLLLLLRWSEDFDENPLHLRARRQRDAALLIGLFILWANFHGAVAVGLVILLATVLCELLQDRGSRRARLLALTAVLCVAAIIINPYGLSYWQALKPVQGRMFPYIDEWKPVWKSPTTELSWLAAGEAVLALIALLLWRANPQRRWAHLAWLLIMIGFFLSARRHLWLLALVSLTVAAINGRSLDSQRLWQAWRRRTQGVAAQVEIPNGMRVIARVGILVLLMVCIAVVTPADFWPLRATSRYLPSQMTNHIKKHRPMARLFNDYENSSYLQWRCAGQPPLFIDLLNAYPDALLVDDYFDIIKANARGRRLLGARKIERVALRRHQSDESLAKLAKFLDRNKNWKHTYKGSDGTVWELKKQQKKHQ